MRRLIGARRRRRFGRGLRQIALPLFLPLLLLSSLYVGARFLGGPLAARLWAAANARILSESASLGLALDHLDVEGRRWTKPSEIRAALVARVHMPIFAIDLSLAQKRLEALPWVRTAAIERRLPDTILVRLVERRPLSLWQQDGKIALIDRSGMVIPVGALTRFAKLPLVVGKDAPRHAATLLAMLAREPRLAARVSAAIRVGERRWNLRLDNAIEVLLPQKGAASAWSDLARVERSDAILERNVAVIDLRLPGRLVVRVNGTPPPTAPDATKGSATARRI